MSRVLRFLQHNLRALEMNIGQFSQMIGQDLTGEQIRAFQIHQLVLQI